jgi:hypothetical protein
LTKLLVVYQDFPHGEWSLEFYRLMQDSRYGQSNTAHLKILTPSKPVRLQSQLP